MVLFAFLKHCKQQQQHNNNKNKNYNYEFIYILIYRRSLLYTKIKQSKKRNNETINEYNQKKIKNKIKN